MKCIVEERRKEKERGLREDVYLALVPGSVGMLCRRE